MIERSRRHLSEAGESYFEHFRFALLVAMLTIGAGLACFIHAFIPGLCQKTCSRTIERLQTLFKDRARLSEIQRDGEGVLTFVGLLLLGLAPGMILVAAGGASVPSLAVAAFSLAIPGAYLLTNGELAALEEPHR